MIKLKQNCKIILASGSKPRAEILKDLGFDFEIIKPHFDEESTKQKIKHLEISDQAMYLAEGKALSVSMIHQNNLVIGSDQICESNKIAIDKSKNRQEAISQLKILQGKTHIQNNAICLYQGPKLLFKNIVKAELTMRNLTDEQIKNYVNLDKSWGCAGSYKYESMAKHLFSDVKGSDNSIIGMDIIPLLNFLHEKNLINLN